MHLLMMHVRVLKKKNYQLLLSTYLLLYVCIYCAYLVLVYLVMYVRTYCTYCCSYLCTYVPTVRTALTNAPSTRLMHKTPVPPVRTRCCTYSWLTYCYCRRWNAFERCSQFVFVFFFLEKSQLELVGVTRETSRHRHRRHPSRWVLAQTEVVV